MSPNTPLSFFFKSAQLAHLICMVCGIGSLPVDRVVKQEPYHTYVSAIWSPDNLLSIIMYNYTSSSCFHLWLTSFTLSYAVVPSKPIVTGLSMGTTVSILWTGAGVSIIEYQVTWWLLGSDTDVTHQQKSATVTGNSTTFTLSELNKESQYSFTVSARSAAGIAVSDPFFVQTGKSE